jgi:nucleotide-binding universal stress UspA family protein
VTRPRIHSILVPTDFGEAAAAALAHAKALAERFNGRLYLLHVIPDPFRYDAWGLEGVSVRTAELLRQSEKAARTALAKLAPAKGRLAGRITTATATGAPVEQILKYAERKRVDLIAIGTHGRGALGHLLLGSVAERVVRHARVPVVTVRAAASRRAPARGRARRKRAREAGERFITPII